MVVFDTAVADLTEELTDPVELLFGVQLGGGTDIHAALRYCAQIITRPLDTVLVLITDLYEGGNLQEMRRKGSELVASGVAAGRTAGPQRPGRPIIRPCQCPILFQPRRTCVRLHSRQVPRPDGCRTQ